jgi:hypothetical protein
MMPAYTNTLSNNILLSNHTKMKNKILPYPSDFQNPIKKKSWKRRQISTKRTITSLLSVTHWKMILCWTCPVAANMTVLWRTVQWLFMYNLNLIKYLVHEKKYLFILHFDPRLKLCHVVVAFFDLRSKQKNCKRQSNDYSWTVWV